MKNYRDNIELNKRVESVVSELTIPKEFKPYVVDILLRRFFQFDFSEEQINTDLNTIKKSLFDIKISDSYDNINGCYMPYSRIINLDLDNMKNRSPEEIYETLVHELYHALSNTETGRDKMATIDDEHLRNSVNGSDNFSLLEAIVERGAYRTVFNTYSNNAFLNNHEKSYNNTTFVVDMLSSTFGVSEQELLRNGLQGRKQLSEFLASKSNCKPEEIARFLDEIETNLNVIHNYTYIHNKQPDNMQLGLNLSEALGNLSKLCLERMNLRLQSIPKEELTPEIIEDFEFGYNKFLNNLYKINESFDAQSSYENSLVVSGFSKTRVMEILTADALTIQNELQRLSNQEITNTVDTYNFSQDVINRNVENNEKNESWDNSITKKFKSTVNFIIFKEKVKKIFKPKKEEKALPLYKYDTRFDSVVAELLSHATGISIEEIKENINKNEIDFIQFLADRSGLNPEGLKLHVQQILNNRNNAQNVLYVNRHSIFKENTYKLEHNLGTIYQDVFAIFRLRIQEMSLDDLTPEKSKELETEFSKLMQSVKSSVDYLDKNEEYKNVSTLRLVNEFDMIAAMAKNAISQKATLRNIDFVNNYPEINDEVKNIIIDRAGNGVLHNFFDSNEKFAAELGITSLEATSEEDIDNIFQVKKEPNTSWNLLPEQMKKVKAMMQAHFQKNEQVPKQEQTETKPTKTSDSEGR